MGSLGQKAVLEHAERLASVLGGGATRVERNVLLSLVGDFMADRSPDRGRLLKTLRLVRAGSGGHLKRGGGYAQQLEAATRELERFLDAAGAEIAPLDLQSVFGWTARLLLVRGGLAPARQQPGARQTGPQPGTRPARRGEGAPPRPERSPAPPPKPFGGLNPQGLSALEKLKSQLEGRGKDKKS